MAIKPVTNENAGYESTTNRESQTSIRSEKGNPKVVIKKPGGQNAGKGFSIGLKEIDTAVITHIRNIMKPKVKEQNEIISVPVLYGNEERGKSIKGRGTLRDKNGNKKMLETVGEKWSACQTLNFKINSQQYYVLISPDLNILNTPIQYTDTETYKSWLNEGLQNFTSQNKLP